MAFLFSKSLQFIQMLDPLQIGHAATQEQDFEVKFNENQACEPSSIRDVEDLPVHCWSVNDVLIWLQQFVHMEVERMGELSCTFQNEGIDGSRLLSLQRNSRACSTMTDAEWLLLHEAREVLIGRGRTGEIHSESQSSSFPASTPKSFTEELSESSLPTSTTRMQTSLTLNSGRNSGSLSSYLKFFSLPRNLWSSTASRHEEKEPTTSEVYLLQEEVLSAQEREASLKARVDHLDQVLRTSQLAGYLYSRIRWTPLPGEVAVEDADVDDWLQRFLVLESSTLFFYPEAADFRPQGAIILKEVVEIGPISGQLLHGHENIKWFGFQVTTSEGLRLECATPLKLQAELWMSLLRDAHAEQHTENLDEGHS